MFGRFLRLLGLLCLEEIYWSVVGVKGVALFDRAYFPGKCGIGVDVTNVCGGKGGCNYWVVGVGP